jgi:hypothetical protein
MTALELGVTTLWSQENELLHALLDDITAMQLMKTVFM